MREPADGLAVDSPATRASEVFRTYADHRMAHAAAILGLRINPLPVDNVATTDKTFPGFAAAWETLAANRTR